MLDLGILGGGQLARMLLYRSAPLGLRIGVLDPDPECPARGMTPHLEVGDYRDPAAIDRLARASRVLTFDLEHVNVPALIELERRGGVIRPSPRVLEVVQDKLRQKRHLQAAGIPQPDFGEELPPHRPLVVKTRTGGYDGRGVQVLRTSSDSPTLPGALYWEEWVATRMELAVIGVVGGDGQPVFYPPVEMVFDPVRNICDQILQPARLEPHQVREALEIGRAVLESFRPLGLVGVMAVEMFLTEDGRLLVNEVAPRPHNSGHGTMEVAYPCQFEAHVRAVLGWPLPEPRLTGAVWMKNLLGRGNGRPALRGREALGDPRVRLHLYAKAECRDGRKMGHLSVVASTPDEALDLGRSLEGVEVAAES